MVFIIAIHTALYVFYPKLNSRSDEGGLWRWRHYVIPLWVVIPGLLAGLAFINPIAYVPLVTWCYLPARPLVWRYALAWGPRYFILLTISVLYVALYFHVRRAYRTIDRNQRENSFSGSELDTDEHPDASHESTPRPKTSLQLPQPSHLQRKRPSIPPPLFEESEKESRASTSASFNFSPSPTSESAIISPPPPMEITPKEAATLRNMSVTTTLNDVLSPSLYNLQSTDHDGGQSFSYHRARVERQMRTLFIFPVVYFIMWIPPFINHLYQVITYNSNATTLPPGTFVVTILATIFLPAQGFVNVCVYAIRERPWRRGKRPQSQPATRAGTFGDWHFHSDKNSERRNSALGIQAQIDQAKINHKRMSNPMDAAYTRRDIERGERELARAQTTDSRHVRSNWWDEEGIEKV
jgi:G protein-coupled receptor GPR1